LDKERDANITGVDYVSQGMSPFAKLEALAAVHFPQFDKLIRELDTAADRCVIWMTNIRLKQVSKTSHCTVQLRLIEILCAQTREVL
jgi:hypothetical protein